MWWTMAVSGGFLLIAPALLIFLIIKKPFLQLPIYNKKKRKKWSRKKPIGYGFIVTCVLLLIAFVAISVLQYFSIVEGEEMSLKEMDQIVKDSDTKIQAAKKSLSQLDFTIYDSVKNNLVKSKNIEDYFINQARELNQKYSALTSLIKYGKISTMIANYDVQLENSSRITGCEPEDRLKLELKGVWSDAEKYISAVETKLNENKEEQIKIDLEEINNSAKSALDRDKAKLTSFANNIMLTLEKWKKSVESLRTSLKKRVTKAEIPLMLFWIVVAFVYSPNLLGSFVVICFCIIIFIQLRQKYKIFNCFVVSIIAAALGTLICLYLFGGEVFLYVVDSQKEGQQCTSDTVSYDMFKYDVPQFVDSAPKINVENIMNTCKSSQNSLFSNIVSIDNIELQSYKKKVIDKISEYKKFWNLSLHPISTLEDRVKDNSKYLAKIKDTCMPDFKEFKEKMSNFENALTNFYNTAKVFSNSINSPINLEEVQTVARNVNDGESKLNSLRSIINNHAKAHDHKCLPIIEISKKAANHQCVQQAIIMDSAETVPIFVMSTSICWSNILNMLILAIFYFRRKKFPGDNLKTAIVSADNLDCNQRNNLLKMCNIISSIDVVAVAKNFREVIGKFKPKDVAITNFLKNDAKNRYGGENGVPCYDKNRVILQNRKNDYIHASWINFPTSRRYICTQGPLEKKDGNDSTIDDFWTMCLQQKVQFVVMLCNPVEDMDEKCDVYYPVSENSVMKLENMKVVCKSLSTTKLESVNWRVLEVSDKNMKKDKPLLINHLQVMWWPDHSIPDQSDLVVKLLDVLHKDNKDPNPIVVHCSAGVGRTGTFVLIDYALDQIKNVEDVTISGCFEFIRSNRAKAVQEDVQYIFVYHAIMRYCVMKDIVKESDMQKFSRIYRDFKEKHKKKMEKINQKMAAQKK